MCYARSSRYVLKTPILPPVRWIERFEALLPKFQDYCKSIANFKRNHFSLPLTPELTNEVERRWGPSYAAFGYRKVGEGDNKTPL